MGTTTNNGWPTPVATDLVKDGWEAIKDLGDAIDTTLGVYAPSSSGLTLINTTSFSAVSSQALTSVFTSTYDNYMLTFYLTSVTSGDVTLKFRSAATDNSVNYDSGGIGRKVSASNKEVNFSNSSSGFITTAHTGTAANRVSGQMTIFRPLISSSTEYAFIGTGVDSGGWYQFSSSGCQFGTNVFDGINLIFGGNTTGVLSLYGLSK